MDIKNGYTKLISKWETRYKNPFSWIQMYTKMYRNIQKMDTNVVNLFLVLPLLFNKWETRYKNLNKSIHFS